MYSTEEDQNLKRLRHGPGLSRIAGGEGIPLPGLGLLLICGLTYDLLPFPQERSLDLLKIRLCVIKNDRRCLAYGIGLYGFYAVNPRHGNPYRGGRVPSDAPRNFDHHGSLSGKHVVIDPKQQCQNSCQRQCHHDSPFHGYPPSIFNPTISVKKIKSRRFLSLPYLFEFS